MSFRELICLLRFDLARIGNSNRKNIGLVGWLNLLHPRFIPVLLIRLSRYCHGSRFLVPLGIMFTWINFFLFGIECTAKCDIGPGLMLPHTSGTVIGASKIGANVTIFQGVTLGALELDMGFDILRRPILSDCVVVGAGAKILGGIVVGEGAVIGANAVVIQNVPAGGVAVGVPAKVIKTINERAT